MEQLTKLYKDWSGQEPAHVEKIAGAGSNRQYYRLTGADGRTVIGVIGTSRDEDHAFVTICRHFNERHLPVPRLLAVSDDEMRYLQSDLGNRSLFDAIKGGREAGGRYNLEEQQLLKRTIRALPAIQINGGTLSVRALSASSDALDANGDIFINGGSVEITADHPFDYEGVALLTGGTLMVNGKAWHEILR